MSRIVIVILIYSRQKRLCNVTQLLNVPVQFANKMGLKKLTCLARRGDVVM
jgi:hypothetical protein